MEPQRRTMALRPPMATTPTPTSNNMPPTAASSVATATRTNSLKRTISKCGIDAAMASSDSSSHIAPKKLAPLHDHAFQHQYNMMARAGTASATPNDVYVDDGEPVLLPRYMAPQCDSDDAHASEYSPVAPFGWDGTPQGAKNRYYESVLESTTSYLASPSPQHILYPYTPLQPGDRSTNSTLSFASSSTYSPMAMHDNNSAMAHTLQPPQPPQVLAERDSLSAANLHAIMLSYLEELFSYYDLARTFTFAKVTEMVRSVPFAFRYIQGMVKNRIGLPWHLVGEFVENILDFIGDDDLREASVKEFADFLLSIQAQLYEAMPGGNIFLNLYEFFQNVLAKFKKYLIATWLATQRIQFPCEFGKKSDTLFLCMECHREHL